jgi:lactate 2-monooxygenase
MTNDFVSIGRAAQEAIYRRGTFGYRPAVPTETARLEAAAKRKLSREAYGYIAGGAGSGATMRANRRAFDQWRIVPRMGRDTVDRDLSVRLFGTTHPHPVITAPVGALDLVRPQADVTVARGARRAGVPMTISSQAAAPMEVIARELGDTPFWYQLYWPQSDELAVSLVQRAERCGARAIVVTLDTTSLGWRTEDLDRGFLPFARALGIAQYTSDPVFQQQVRDRIAAPAAAEKPKDPIPRPKAVRALFGMAKRVPGGFLRNLASPVPRTSVETFLEGFSRQDLTWDRLAWLKQQTSLPVLVKGVQCAEDVRLALDSGADGIWVSNHGGRQVDGAVASLAMLPEIVEAAGGAPIVFDSGVRTGSDVAKALALGADAVAIGRPWTYGLAVDGAAGVAAVLRHIVAELDLTLSLSGVRRAADLELRSGV